MTILAIEINTPVEALNKAFLLNHPKDAARKIETMRPQDSAKLLGDQPAYIAARLEEPTSRRGG